jgi:biotin transport system substrate-specific component
MPRRSTARDLAQIAVFAALIAALGLPGSITIGSTGVPITLQTLGIMLTGGILGARKGFLAVTVFLVLTTAGLPLLAGGRGGIGIWAGPSAGYLIGFLVGVVVIGLMTVRVLPRYRLWQGITINLLGGAAVIYLFGVAWLSIRTAFGPAVTSVVAYLPGDVLKAVIAALVIKQVHRSYPGLLLTDRKPFAAASGRQLGPDS